MNSVNSKHEAVWITHQIVLDDEVMEVSVDINYCPNFDFQGKYRDLLLLKFTASDMDRHLLTTIGDQLVGARFAGNVYYPNFVELAFYCDGDSSENGVFTFFGESDFDCYITKSDEGRFYKNFLIPKKFGDLTATLAECLDGDRFEGKHSIVRYFFLKEVGCNEKQFIEESVSRGFCVDRLISNSSSREKICLRANKVISYRDQHFDLARFYELAEQNGVSFDTIEFDFR